MKLLILSCGARKRDASNPLPAGELYTGPLWSTLRKHRKPGTRVLVLSAEHGLIPEDKAIMPYDRMLDPERVAELAQLRAVDKCAGVIRKVFPDPDITDTVAVCGGGLYVQLARQYVHYAYRCGFLPSETPDTIINGGIGYMRKELQEWLCK